MTAGTALFFYGTLRHAPLLAAVAGRNIDARPAVLRDHMVSTVAGESFPRLCRVAGSKATGVLIDDPGDEALARLDFYEGAYGYALEPVTVETDGGPVPARTYFPPDMLGTAPEAPWDLADWVARWGALATEAAREAVGARDRMTPEEAGQRYPQMLARAAQRLRAAETPRPAALRRGMSRDRVRVVEDRHPYTNFFAVGEQDLAFATFAGGESPVVTRAAFVAADAVTVLPYDPVRDNVLLIEQFRFGAYMRGDPIPWTLEAIAGRIDPGEAPEDAARREAREEAGLEIAQLHHVGSYYPSPGCMTEYLISYVAFADLPPEAARVAGLAGEAEDILGHVIGFDRLMDLLASGEIENGPLVLTAHWLASNRDRLRGLA